MNYEEAKASAFAMGTVASMCDYGRSVEHVPCCYALGQAEPERAGKAILCVWDRGEGKTRGMFPLNIRATDRGEAVYLLNNHPGLRQHHRVTAVI
jgi:hypothetical protein